MKINSNKNKLELKDKVVVITGASSGIGIACSISFAEKGAYVVLASRNLIKLQVVQEFIHKKGQDAIIIQTDVRNHSDCKILIDKVIELFNRIDILICCAGVTMNEPFHQLDLKVFHEMIDTNFWGTVNITKQALPHLIKVKGIIIGITPIESMVPFPNRIGSVASSHATRGFLETLRIEILKSGMKVKIIHPGKSFSNLKINSLYTRWVSESEIQGKLFHIKPSRIVAKNIAKKCIGNNHNLFLAKWEKLIAVIHNISPSLIDRIILARWN